LNIVITGCSKGIGAELVKLLSENHNVFGLSRDIGALKKLKTNLSNSSNFHFIMADICELNKEIIDKWINVNSIDVLVNNAGLLINKQFSDISYQDYKNVMDVNFWGAFHLSQLLLEKLSVAKGQIINISSVGGVNYSSKFPGLSLYSSSKGALSILSECLAEELKPYNIRVNALALGAVQTEMLNMAFPDYKANVTPKEMSNYIINFINSVGNVMNGQVVKVSSSNP
jgi:short-subunit dehydrogenase